MSEQPAATLDVLGLPCPMPVVRLSKTIGTVPVGSVVEVLSDDEAAKVDIPVWCRMKKHEYLGVKQTDRGPAHLVRRLS